MVDAYIKATGNITILERALPAMTVCALFFSCLPLADLYQTEMTWWLTNRSIEVTSPFTGKTHSVYHYDVSNTAPRPEVSHNLSCRHSIVNPSSADEVARVTRKTTLLYLAPLQLLTRQQRVTYMANLLPVLRAGTTILSDGASSRSKTSLPTTPSCVL